MDTEEALRIADEDSQQRSCLPRGMACVALAAEVRRLREQSQWQPIETAPKDGEWIIAVNESLRSVLSKNPVPFPARYVYDEGTYLGWDDEPFRATHWMPIPPTDSEGGAG